MFVLNDDRWVNTLHCVPRPWEFHDGSILVRDHGQGPHTPVGNRDDGRDHSKLCDLRQP